VVAEARPALAHEQRVVARGACLGDNVRAPRQ
jgi:hypothetical protein